VVAVACGRVVAVAGFNGVELGLTALGVAVASATWVWVVVAAALVAEMRNRDGSPQARLVSSIKPTKTGRVAFFMISSTSRSAQAQFAGIQDRCII
jgi:hypothetical protein